MQIELNHIGRLQAAGGMGGQEQFVDVLPQQLAHGYLLAVSRGRAFGDNHATAQLVLTQGLQPIREVAHLKDFSPHARLGMDQFQIAGRSEPRLYFRVREQLIVPCTREIAESSLLNAR